jgi:RIP metalloprotease RseP
LLHILDIIAKVLFVVVFFGLCIFIHELGHLLVALWQKLYVERFSVGFGKKIWGKTVNGVEYIVSMLPFGGYVALPQLDPSDEPKTSDGTPLPSGPPVSRALTAVAGPLANVLFGFFLGLFIWWFGTWEPIASHQCKVLSVPPVLPLYENGLKETDEVLSVNGVEVDGYWDQVVQDLPKSIVAVLPKTDEEAKEAKPLLLKVLHEDSKEPVEIEYKPTPNPEYVAGLRPGDAIVAVDGKGFDRGSKSMNEKIVLATGTVRLTVRHNGEERTIRYKPAGNPLAEGLGYPFFEVETPVAISHLEKNSPAEKAGLKVGDQLLEINGQEVENPAFFSTHVRDTKGEPFTVTVKRKDKERGDEILEIGDLRAEEMTIDGDTHYRIGAGLDVPRTLEHPNPWQQFVSVFTRTKDTLASLFAPMVHKRSLVRPKHMSGPIGILQMIFFKVFTDGYRGGLSFIILVTFSLAFFNLLPLPILDGGHIVYSLIEIVFRRKLPTRVVYWLQTVFAVLLISFMAYVSFYDVRRAPRFWHFFFGKEKENTEEVQPAEPAKQKEAEPPATPAPAPEAN